MSASGSVFVESGGQRAALEQVALAATAAEVDEHGEDLLVLALWPTRDQRKVIASPGNSAIRAAISVAIAAGNIRAWSAVEGDGVVDIPVPALPEIIRAAVEPAGVRSVQVAAVADGEETVCLTMWLSPAIMVTDGCRDRHTAIVGQLRAAAEADRARREELARQLAADAAARAAVAGDRTVQRPAIGGPGAAAALPDRDHFDRTLGALQCDEAAILVLGIDDPVAAAGEVDMSPDVVRDTVAERLTQSVRKHDVIAYVGDDTFAVLLVNVDRHTAFEISRRLRASVAEAIGDDAHPLSVSVGLSHEDGLIDACEMFEAATSAMHDARLEGGSRMLIAC